MKQALQSLMAEQDPEYFNSIKSSSIKDDSRTNEEIIADNYVTLAKFTIEKLQIKNASKLKVEESECVFVIYALTPEPKELDFVQFATSDYPDNKELLLEAEALQADLFMEDNTEGYKREIMYLIENAIL